MILALVVAERSIKSVMGNKLDKKEIKDISFFVVSLLILIAVNFIPIYYNYKITKIKDSVDNYRVLSQQLQTRYLSDQNSRNMILINLMASSYFNRPLEGDFKKITEKCEENLKDNIDTFDYLRKIQICYNKDIELINNQQLSIDKIISSSSSEIDNILNRNNYLNIFFITINIIITIYISNRFEKIFNLFKKLFSK